MTPPTPNQSSGTLKDIFNRIEGREWDWFGMSVTNFLPYLTHLWITMHPLASKNDNVFEAMEDRDYVTYSLADLLANKSWCQAVWGNEQGFCCVKSDHGDCGGWHLNDCDTTGYYRRYEYFSERAFKILRDEGIQSCINYILKTII